MSRNRKNGQWKHPDGYIQCRIWENGIKRIVLQHRYIMEKYLNKKLLPSEDVHHINGIKDDNRVENLQLICHKKHSTLTNKTVIKKHKSAKSKHPGVCWNSKSSRWYCKFKRNGKVILLGTFKNELDAKEKATQFLASEGKTQ